jgi:hypothetical protein
VFLCKEEHSFGRIGPVAPYLPYTIYILLGYTQHVMIYRGFGKEIKLFYMGLDQIYENFISFSLNLTEIRKPSQSQRVVQVGQGVA